MDSYRVEVLSQTAIKLENEDVEMDPVPTGGGGAMPEPEIDLLSSTIRELNEVFGHVDWKD